MGWHRSWVENLRHALHGIHAGLGDAPPPQYQGVAVYSEWAMNEADWATLRREFLHSSDAGGER